MAKKKIYAVRKGHKTGLFATWAECQKAVSGYSGIYRERGSIGFSEHGDNRKCIR